MKRTRTRISFFVVVCALCCLMGLTGADAAVVRLGVMKFEIKSANTPVSYRDQLSQTITDIFTNILSNTSKSMVIVDRRHLDELGQGDIQNMVAVGRLAGCQYMILGAVMQLQEDMTYENSPASSGSRKSKGSVINYYTNDLFVTLDTRIIDVATGEVKASFTKTGRAKDSFSLTFTTGGNFQMQQSEQQEAIKFMDKASRERLKQAATIASSRLSDKICGLLTGEYAQILSVDGSDININRGASAGVKVGTFYRIYSEDGEADLDLDGTPLGENETDLAIIKVNDIRDTSSSAEVAYGQLSAIHREDKIEMIAKEDVEELAKQNSFSPHSPQMTLSHTIAADNNPENNSTDPAKIIPTYGLSANETKTRRIAHINAGKLKGQRAYKKYMELANSYDGDYLAAYRAAETAQALGKKADARRWINKALNINPNYKPAQELQKKLK